MPPAPNSHDETGFSAHTLAVLQAADWSPTRAVTIDPWVALLEQCGFLVFAPVREFLTRFGGLAIIYQFVGEQRVIDLDVAQAAAAASREQVAHFAERIGSPLCPVGRYLGTLLMMSIQGHIYGCNPRTTAWIFWGENGEQAIDNMVTGRYFPSDY